MLNEIDIVNSIVKKRQVIDDMEIQRKLLSQDVESLEQELYDLMETKGVKSISSGDYTATAVKPQLRTKVLAEAKEELIKWVSDVKGRDDLITRSVHPSTLAKYISEEVLKNGEEPPAFIEMYFQKTIRIRKKGATNE